MSVTFIFHHTREGEGSQREEGREGKGMGKGRGREDKRKGKKLLLLRIEPLYKFLLLRDRRLHVKKLFTCHANTLNAVSI